MSVAHDIGQIIANNSLGTLGEDLFISQMPETPDTAVAVYETGGSAYRSVADIHTSTVTIKARSTEYESAYSLISGISDFLCQIGDEINYSEDTSDDDSQAEEETIGETEEETAEETVELPICTGVEENGNMYLRVQSQSEPYPVSRDNDGRIEFAQSYSVTFFKIEAEETQNG